MITVRPAAPHDVDWLMEQLRSFDRFFGTTRSLFPDEEYARTQLRQLIGLGPFFVADRRDGACNGDDERHGHAVCWPKRAGFIAGFVAPHFMNPDLRVLNELFWWVDESFRGSSAGARLLDAFLAHGREHADWIVFTLEAKSPVHPATLERKGFHLHERSYLLEVTT